MTAKPVFPTTRDLPGSPLRCMTDAFLNLIYPEVCFICSAPIARQQDCGVCQKCWERSLQLRIVPPWCSSCGLPFQSFDPGSTHLCSSCIIELPPYSGARSFGYYTADLSLMIQELKFRGRRNLIGLLSPLLAGAFLDSWNQGEFDLLIPIPLHPKRKRKRGFNQAALLARALSRLIVVPSCENALARVRYTIPQVGLSDSERLRNLHNAFHCKAPEKVAGRRLLLIDDVMTTGATVASATGALLAAGAARVSVLTIARAVSNV